jgi:branched-chain amino acid transport system substrate-binding protein
MLAEGSRLTAVSTRISLVAGSTGLAAADRANAQDKPVLTVATYSSFAGKYEPGKVVKAPFKTCITGPDRCRLAETAAGRCNGPTDAEHRQRRARGHGEGTTMLRTNARLTTTMLAGAAMLALTAAASAQVKIGFITTLSTPGGYLGEDARDGFLLAVGEEGGKLGGVPVQVLVEDDKLKPADGKQIAEKWLESEKVKLFSGIIFSNVAVATVPQILESGGIFVSPNAGPSNFAGKGCHANYYVTSWQNDNLHESAGALAKKLGYEKMVILAPNYQAGKDALAGFKRMFGGEIVEEIYTNLDQTDFSAEMARIRSMKPDAVFQFHPGGQGIAFLKQWSQAGLKDQIPMVVAAPSLDQKIAAVVGDAAIGIVGTTHWNTDFDNDANRAFVKGFREKYNRDPTIYASQGYDAAKLIAAGLKASGGKVEDPAFRAGMLEADVKLSRGAFKFAANQHPVQDWYEVKAVKGADGKVTLQTVGKVLTQLEDAYARDCKI